MRQCYLNYLHEGSSQGCPLIIMSYQWWESASSNRTKQFGEGAKHPQRDDQEYDEDVEIADISDEDVERLNTQLDQLNSALDDLEQKNESIQARLLELLKSNRELRNEGFSEQSQD